MAQAEARTSAFSQITYMNHMNIHTLNRSVLALSMQMYEVKHHFAYHEHSNLENLSSSTRTGTSFKAM